MSENPYIDRIHAEAPPLWAVSRRIAFYGRVATELAGTVSAGLPFDDASKPARWHRPPAATAASLERLAQTRRPLEVLGALQRTAEAFSQEPGGIGHNPARWANTSQELRQLYNLMVTNQGQ